MRGGGNSLVIKGYGVARLFFRFATTDFYLLGVGQFILQFSVFRGCCKKRAPRTGADLFLLLETRREQRDSLLQEGQGQGVTTAL